MMLTLLSWVFLAGMCIVCATLVAAMFNCKWATPRSSTPPAMFWVGLTMWAIGHIGVALLTTGGIQ